MLSVGFSVENIFRCETGLMSLFFCFCRGTCPISSFLDQNQIQEDMENLKVVEETLDGLIRTSDQQLYDMTNDRNNSIYPFLTPRRHRSLFTQSVLQ